MTYQPLTYRKQGGDEFVVASGGKISIETGGDIEVNGVSLIDEVAALSGLDSGELGVLNGVTAGTVTASKALVVDANKDIGDLRNLDVVNLDAGASGVAGSVDVFPTTASKGKVAITTADNAGDTTTGFAFAEQAGARTYTIPDAGASASVMMTEGAQTVNGDQTLAGDNEVTGSLQSTKTTAVTADGTPPVLTFTGGINLVSFTTNADDIVHLPTNVAGDIGKDIEIYAVQGFELRSADASATLNGVTIGATNEAAFVAGTYARIKCVADNTWLAVESVVANGTPTQIVPDVV